MEVGRISNKLSRWALRGAYLYLALVVAAWLLMRFAGDRWWFGSLILFGPRWMLFLPLLVLMPLAAWCQRLALIPLIAASVVVAGPLMGFVVSMPSGNTEQRGLRIITCNTETGNAKKRLERLVEESSADIVALQECPRDLPIALPKGWSVIQKGELAVLSRFPMMLHNQVMSLHPPHIWPRYSAIFVVVDTPGGKIGFCTVHLPSPRYGLEHMLDRKIGINFAKTDLVKSEQALRSSVAWDVKRMIEAVPLPVVVAGDFNMPVESRIYRENFGGFTDTFSKVGFGFGHTEFISKHGLSLSARIDHILTSREFRPISCVVGPDVGSDHRPLIVHLIKRSN
ncbi:MAG: endonuclease/exonuclease/phosphatase family protein [Geobacteraceae bacterium]|nr:endonuclease/exonuclease/phosphatase family protein [Geobacteraceae bacterium]